MVGPSYTGYNTTSDIFFEKQHLMHCAVHALNNLYQEHWCSYGDLASQSQSLFRADRETGQLRYVKK